MDGRLKLACVMSALFVAGGGSHARSQENSLPGTSRPVIELPRPRATGAVSLEEALLKRRSVREFDAGGLTLEEVSQLLWAAQGITSSEGFRTAPSAGALYPLEVYLAAGQVIGLASGVYRYSPEGHRLIQTQGGDLRKALRAAALGQAWVSQAPAVIIISAIYDRTKVKYGQRGERYAIMEVGHAVQNVYLQAVALNLGTVIVGAFEDDQIRQILHLDKQEHPLALMPVGRLLPDASSQEHGQASVEDHP